MRKGLFQQVLPHFAARKAERKLQERLDRLREDESLDFPIDDEEQSVLSELAERLESLREAEVARKHVIEDKAKATLFIVSLTISLLLGSLSFVSSNSSITPTVGIVFLVAGIVYMVASGLTCVAALNTRGFYQEALSEIVREVDGELQAVLMDQRDRICLVYEQIKLNQIILTIKANYVYATFLGIRNGIILISVFSILMLGALVVHIEENNTSDRSRMVDSGSRVIIFICD